MKGALSAPVLDREGGASRLRVLARHGSGRTVRDGNTPAPAKIRRAEARKQAKRRGNGGAAHQEADGERQGVEVVGDEQPVLGKARRSSGPRGRRGRRRRSCCLPSVLRASRVKRRSGGRCWREEEGDGGRSHAGDERSPSVSMATAEARERAAAGEEEERSRVRVSLRLRGLKRRGEGAGQRAWGRAAEAPRHGLSAPPRCKGVRRKRKEELGRAGGCWAREWPSSAWSSLPTFFFCSGFVFSFLKLSCFCIFQKQNRKEPHKNF